MERQSIEPLWRLNHQFINDLGELSGGFRRLIEAKMPEVWEKYIDTLHPFSSGMGKFPLTNFLNDIMNPQNLFDFLNANREMWGWKECPNFDCNDGHKLTPSYEKSTCEVCNGTGKIKHLALEWLEGRDK
jgi:hypothetical protein